MLARLFAQKRIDAPSAVDPEGEISAIKTLAQINNVICFHGLASSRRS